MYTISTRPWAAACSSERTFAPALTSRTRPVPKHPSAPLWPRGAFASLALTNKDWKALRAEIEGKGVRIVALDLPTSWSFLTTSDDEFTARMLGAINGMLLDLLAAIARKDYDDRRRRQEQGQAKAKTAGLYRGRREDTGRNDGIAVMLKAGQTWRQVQEAVGCSRATVAKIAKRLRPLNLSEL